MLSKEEFRQQAALSIVQGVIEARYGIIGELEPKIAIKETMRIANALTDELFKE